MILTWPGKGLLWQIGMSYMSTHGISQFHVYMLIEGSGGEGELGLIFAGYVPLALRAPTPF